MPLRPSYGRRGFGSSTKIRSGTNGARLMRRCANLGYRSDYDPARSTFTLRMPTPLHCYFADSVIQAVLERIATLAESLAEQHPEASQWLKLLRCGANEDIDLASDNDDDKSAKRSPDGTLGHRKAEYPPAVFEVSYSQKRKQLPALAHSYIVDSCHGIRCVIGLDIEYERPRTRRDTGVMMRKEASLSVWRARLWINEDTGEAEADCEAEVVNEVFRRQDGSAGIGSLRLTMHDLLPKALLSSDEGRLCRLPRSWHMYRSVLATCVLGV